MSEILEEEQDEQAWQRADEKLDMQAQLNALVRLTKWPNQTTHNAHIQDARFISSKLGLSDEFDKLINYKHEG